MIKIGVVDDKLLNRNTVRKNLQQAGDLAIVLEASNGIDFLDKMEHFSEQEQPDLVLMDIDMPLMNGIEAIAIGTIKYPRTRFLILTVFDDDSKIFEAIQAGASGYLLKDDSALQLKEAITQTLEYNAVPMSPAIARKTLNWLKQTPRPESPGDTTESHPLTEREVEIIKKMVEGQDYKQIAAQLFISPNTVRSHISKIYEKLHINSRAQAVQVAYKYKWV